MSLVSNFLGLNQFSPGSRDLFRRYITIRFIASLSRNLSDTIYMLFLIDQLGYTSAALLVSITMFVQLVIDYPSGNLGDWIGQKWVLMIAFVCFGTAYFILFSATTFAGFTIMAIFEGIGRAQASGALDSWLDNNFQKMENHTDDPDRRNYGFTKSRLFTVFVLVLSIIYTTGGAISELMSRRFVFFLQIIFSGVAMVAIYFLISDGSKSIDTEEKKPSKSYWTLFKEGVAFLFSSKPAFFYIVGMAIFFAVWVLWLSLLAFPIFFAYTGSDSYTSLVRSIGFIGGIFIQLITSQLSKKIANKRFPFFMFLHGLYYIAFIILLATTPTTYQFKLGIFVILVLFELVFNMTIWPIASTLHQRIMLDLIPSENRNGIYSLQPTIENIIVIPLLMLAGHIIENYGLLEGTMLAATVAGISTVFLFIATLNYFKE